MSAVINKDVRLKLEKFSNLPSIPQVLFKIKQISDDPKATAADLANVILSDHHLTSRILRMANSVYYRDYAGKITTVTHGIVVMGFRAVHNIAVSMAVYDVVNHLSENSKFDTKAFWTRSLACGVIAKFLALRIGRPKLIEVAFIAGFMHDIGQAILAGAFPDKYEQISRIEAEAEDVYNTERVLLGIDHLAAGEYVSKKWNLPLALIQPIADHHRLSKKSGQRHDNIVVDLVYLGDRLHPYVLAADDLEIETLPASIKEVLGLIDVAEEDIVQGLAECRKQVTEIAAELEIEIEISGKTPEQPSEGVAEMQQELSRKEVQLAFMQNATQALAEAKTDDEILQVICEAVFLGLQMGRAIVFEYDPRWESFAGKVGFGFESQKEVHALSFSAKKGLFRYLRETGDHVSVVDDSVVQYGQAITGEETQRLEATAFTAAPLKILDEVRYVVFTDAADRSEPITDEYLRSILALTKQGEVFLERSLLRAKLAEV